MPARRVVTLHFDPDAFLSLVNDELDELGVLSARFKGVETRRWHVPSWTHRHRLPPSCPLSDVSSWASTEDLYRILSTIDRVFVSAEPVREILNYVRWLGHYASGFLESFDEPSDFLFARAPHYPWEVVLAIRAASLGHRVAWLEPTLLQDRVVLASGTSFEDPEFLNSPIATKYGRGELGSQREHFSRAANADEPLLKRISWRFGVVIWALHPGVRLPIARAAALNRKNQAIYSRRRLVAAYIRVSAQHRRNRRSLRSLSSNPAQLPPYVLVALHYQPEASTDPLGGKFSNQVAFVAALRFALDAAGRSNVPILVREHPRQVAARVLGLGEAHFRNQSIYAQLVSIPNVFIAPVDSPIEELLDRAVAAASVNGSLLWQGLLAGRPTISGRRMWFHECAATASLDELEDPARIIALLQMPPREVRESISRLLTEQRVAFPGATSDRYVTSPDKPELAAEMAGEIQARLGGANSN